MVVLALDTATREGSVALLTDGACHTRVGDAGRTHGERLPTELMSLLSEHRRTLSDVDLLAVIAGPGSFTGLRVGMAAVQGLALVAGLKVVPVPTLEAMADAWIARRGPTAPLILAPCLDGQRGDVFFAAWMVEGGGRGRPLIEPAVGRPEDLRRELEQRQDATPVVLVGGGGRLYADAFTSATQLVKIDDLPFGLAEIAARTAAEHPDRAVAPHALRPIYIRRPDAELARERAHRSRADTPGTGALESFPISRATEADDLSEIEALQRRAFVNAWGAEAIRWELAHTDVARLYVTRGPNGAIVAYCACWLILDELHVNSLAVDEAWRRRGLARRLLAHVFRDGLASGARRATLEVRESNRAARALYEGLGFHVEAVRRDYYQEPREDALILWHRRLGEE